MTTRAPTFALLWARIHCADEIPVLNMLQPHAGKKGREPLDFADISGVGQTAASPPRPAFNLSIAEFLIVGGVLGSQALPVA
jgi:hypothetical protein